MFQILLSAYNGEKYLREQLDSFLALEGYDNISVLVRDDGSSDKTPEILAEYRDKYGFQVLFGRNLGITKSYNELFKNADIGCEWFAFSDQDDIWLRDKLTRATERLSAYSSENIILFGSSSQIYDGRKEKGTTAFPKRGVSFENALIQNVIAGHTMVVSRGLLRLLVKHENGSVPIIDQWIYQTASAFGTVIYDETPAVLYRQHDGNNIGYSSNVLMLTLKRLKRFFSGDWNDSAVQARLFDEEFGEMLSEERRKSLHKIAYPPKTLVGRFLATAQCGLYRQSRVDTLLFKILYLLGKYKIKGD